MSMSIEILDTKCRFSRQFPKVTVLYIKILHTFNTEFFFRVLRVEHLLLICVKSVP